MASLNSSQISAISFTFSTPIKLERSNYMIRKSQVISSIKGNGLERLIESKEVPEGSNPELWKRRDQILMSWLMSCMSLEILVLVASSASSFELWKRLEKQFGSETEAKKVQLKSQLINLKKGNMSLTEYFAKLKSITDNLAVAGYIVDTSDFITHLITPLGQEYDPVVVLITANLATMSVDDAYGMLLAHEARLEGHHISNAKEAKTSFNANLTQSTFNQRNNQGRSSFGRGSFNNLGILYSGF